MANELSIDGFAISSNVIATIVTIAAEKVDGVAYVNGHNVATSLITMLTSKPTVAEDTVECEVTDGKLDVTLPIAVFFGYTFPEVAQSVREAVAAAVTTQIGVSVGAVNVRIDELVFPKE